MDLNIVVNKAYIPYLNRPQRTQIFFGGSSSGKSYFLAQKIVLDNIKGVNWLCCRNVAKTIRKSIFNEICKAIITMGLSPFYSINKTELTITNKKNRKQILFAGLDDPEKVKSITPQDGIIERIFVEEATEITYDAYKQLTKRIRGASRFSKCIILAFNPILKSHWIYKEFFKNWDETKSYYEDEKISILKTTYKDNSFLSDEDKESLVNEQDPYYYAVYSLGNWGVLGHIIFKNWRTEDLSGKIPYFDNLRLGMDFGYSSDPNALIKVHIDHKNKIIYVFDEWYQAGMSDEELLTVCRVFVGHEYINCDCADPKTIDFLASNNINATSSVKGPDSINRGIRYIQGYTIVVDIRCQNFKNEIEQYHWKEDKYGNAMAKPVDANNHLMDALRYALEDDMLGNEVTVGVRI